MIFTEARFLFFFLVLFVVYWSLRGNRSRKFVLLVASYSFYAAWDWRFLSLIWISTLVDYIAGRKIDRRDLSSSVRKRWLLASIATNLGMLGFFKYFNFFVDSAASFLNMLGFEAHPTVLNIILPVGISFFTFQTMSYSIDIYRGRLKHTDSLLDFSLFVGFFPQLVAGPIIRARDFLPQLATPRVFANIDVRGFLILFLIGFFKKACISDNISGAVDAYFQSPELYTAASAWIAILLYAIQIYCDFSGYTDMAIATAGLLGFRLCLNFNFPYFARDISDFWRRWHISLSTWLRDYLYISLGGNRGTRAATVRNLMVTMLLGGLWHGAAWTFVIWGGLHGLALLLHRYWRDVFKPRLAIPSFGGVVGTIVTFYWVCLAWIFFRAPDLAGATQTVKAYVLFQSSGPKGLPLSWFVFIVLLAIVHRIAFSGRLRSVGLRLPSWGFSAAYGIAWSLTLAFSRPNALPFIYFQF